MNVEERSELRARIDAARRDRLTRPLEVILDFEPVKTPARLLDPGRCIPHAPSFNPSKHTRITALTKRRIEILQLIANGTGGNAEIAERLGLSIETVKSHVKTCLDLLDARDRAHAVANGFRRGLLT